MERFPSRNVSISFMAVILREKLIHIGITKIMTITDLDFSELIARMYAVG